MADTVVVDLSHWQDDADFATMKAAGILGVVLKATEGTAYVDPTYAGRHDAAEQAGLAVCSYHFLKHGSITAQMELYNATVIPVVGERMVIDYEDQACTINDLKDACKALLNLNPTLQVTIYGANGFLGAQLGGVKDDYLSQFSLWVASYTSNPEPTMTNLKATWPTWSLWQYTDKANVPGNPAPVDGNRFNGSDANCLAWLLPAGARPKPPVPKPVPESVPAITLNIESDQPVTLKITGGANVTVYS